MGYGYGACRHGTKGTRHYLETFEATAVVPPWASDA